MVTNGNITIYNPRIDGNHDVIYYRCLILNVWVIYREINRLSTNTALEENKLIARIPLEKSIAEKTYIDPKGYDSVSPGEYFTLAPGSIAIRGVTNLATATKAELMDKYELVTITAVHDNRYGRLNNQHWKIEGM